MKSREERGFSSRFQFARPQKLFVEGDALAEEVCTEGSMVCWRFRAKTGQAENSDCLCITKKPYATMLHKAFLVDK